MGLPGVGSPPPGTCSKEGSEGRGEGEGSGQGHTERREAPPQAEPSLLLHQGHSQPSGHTTAHKTPKIPLPAAGLCHGQPQPPGCEPSQPSPLTPTPHTPDLLAVPDSLDSVSHSGDRVWGSTRSPEGTQPGVSNSAGPVKVFWARHVGGHMARQQEAPQGPRQAPRQLLASTISPCTGQGEQSGSAPLWPVPSGSSRVQ